MTRNLLLLLCSVLISGCSSYRRDFNCPVDKGLECASMGQVHQAMNAGLWPTPEAPVKIPTPKTQKASCGSCQGSGEFVEAVVDGPNGPHTLRIPTSRS